MIQGALFDIFLGNIHRLPDRPAEICDAVIKSVKGRAI
jgi:hypothetical protein